MDVNAWKRQQLIDQLVHNLQWAWDREEWTADILGETLADVVPFHLDPSTVNVVLNEILALGVSAKRHNTLNQTLNEVVADEYLERRRQEIITAVLVAA